MYWFAHLIYLISPFEARLEPVDWRFWVSLSGLRFLWIDYNFFYLNAAWWYFCLIIQLFALFPILMAGLRKWGPIPFLLVAVVVGFLPVSIFSISTHPVGSGFWEDADSVAFPNSHLAWCWALGLRNTQTLLRTGCFGVVAF